MTGGKWLAAIIAVVAGACSGSESEQSPAEVSSVVNAATIPAELAAGESAFDTYCASCHGRRALGTERGPPLVHVIYEPSHHADIAFLYAAQRGVRAHHWGFGDMPPVPAVTREEIEQIIAYVRHLQRLVGIG